MQQKRLIRSINNRNIAGVCAGIADYFNTDPTIVRLLFVLVALATAVFPVGLIYLVLAVVLPQGQTAYGPTQGWQPPQWQQQQQWQQGQPQGYQQTQPQPHPSTYQGSNELGNMGTPVSDSPQQPQREYAPQPNYGGNPNLGNMGQGQAAPQGGYNPNAGGGYNPGGDGNNTMRATMNNATTMMQTNPWAGVLLGIVAIIAFSTLLGGLHLVGWGVYGAAHGIAKLFPLLLIGFVIFALARRNRHHR